MNVTCRWSFKTHLLSFSLACRQLGFAYGEMSVNYNDPNGSDVPIGMEYFSCSIADQYLSDCDVYFNSYYYYYCTHNQDVFLTCYKSKNL